MSRKRERKGSGRHPEKPRTIPCELASIHDVPSSLMTGSCHPAGESMDEERIGVQDRSGQVADVLVMGEQDDLRAVGEPGEEVQRGGGAAVVELDEDVVG